MLPNASTLTPLPDRPKSLVATGRISGSGNWEVTEFRGKGDFLYYKYQRGAGRKFEVLWYVNHVGKT